MNGQNMKQDRLVKQSISLENNVSETNVLAGNGVSSISTDTSKPATKKSIFIVNNPVFGLCIVIHGKPFILCMCHHLPERSIKFFGIENYLCARCFGTMCGAVIGFVLLNIYSIPFLISVILLLPLIFDGFLQMLTKYESINRRRFITGLMFGIGIFPFMWYVTNYILAFFGFEEINNSIFVIYSSLI